MSFFNGVVTFGLVLTSLVNFNQGNWHSAVYFLVGAGFYALWAKKEPAAVDFNGCNFTVFSESEKKEQRK